MNPNDIADRLETEKNAADAQERQTRQLYTMKCFDTLFHPEGWPLATRVPGGWIFFMLSGGGSLSLVNASDEDGNPEQQIMGQMASTLTSTFVPYSDEFGAAPKPWN